jgi:hypothetical protein
VKFYYTLSINDVRRGYWPYMPADLPVMLPASSWSPSLKPPKLPAHVQQRAADCGGFVATFRWGDYRYTPDQYVAWLDAWRPQWAATMDYCCEPELAEGGNLVRDRQERTTAMAELFWHEFRDAPWAWTPTVQGWEVEDYRRHARELRPLVENMRRVYGDEFRVGVGTLCRRASVLMIHQVVRAVAEELPGVGLHLWGVKLGALQSRMGLPDQVVSVDSAAWNYDSGSRKHKSKRHELGLSQRVYCWREMLPRYRAKVEAALAAPKQRMLL